MAEKKSIIEEALLDINTIKEAINANTKEILRSVAKEEIDGVVKESLEEKDYEEEDEFENDEPFTGNYVSSRDVEETNDDSDMNGGYTGAEGTENEYEDGMDAMASDELDMTDASDDDVIAIYKKLSGEDEIEIVGDEIHLNITEPGQYVVKSDGMGAESGDEELGLEPAGDDMLDIEGGEDFEDSEDDVEYEIEMDDEGESETPEDVMGGEESEDEESEGEESEEGESEEEEQLDEKISIGTGMSVGTHRNKTAAGSIGAPENPKALDEAVKARKIVSETVARYNSLLTETAKLKTENEEFRKALKEFRNKLVETVVYNSNLTYVTKLFMEHATTKIEKDSIIKRFDEVSSIKESKKLYKTIANELEVRKPISESVENKIIKEATSSTSKQLTESTAYVDPSTKRIMDLIQRVEKR
jgi:hypothetical protein